MWQVEVSIPLGHARRRPVAAAVAGGAEKGATLHHLAGQAQVLGGGIDAGLTAATAGIGDRAAARLGLIPVALPLGVGGVVLVPVVGPFPDIADAVEQAIAVGGERPPPDEVRS